MKKWICLTLLLGFVSLGFSQQAKEKSALQSMVDTELAFARMAAEQGIRPSFMAFIAEDGILFRPRAVRGKQWMIDHPVPPSDQHPLLRTSAGYEVSEATNGTRVCDMHQQQCFDLVITDLVMPDKEGLTVIRELRRIDQDVRIIAMSGGRQGKGQEYLRIAQKLGAHLTLSKPFGSQEFLEAVRLALDA